MTAVYGRHFLRGPDIVFEYLNDRRLAQYVVSGGSFAFAAAETARVERLFY